MIADFLRRHASAKLVKDTALEQVASLLEEKAEFAGAKLEVK